MKKIIILISILFCISGFVFAQEAVSVNGSNTSISTYGQDVNQFDALINPTLIGNLQGETLFFSLDNSGTQFGQPFGIESIRGGWAVNDGLGFMFDYQTATNTDYKEVGGEDTPDNAEDDYQNITLDYGNFDQATGEYATITETVNDNLKSNTIDHDLLFHSIFGIGDGMAAAAQLLLNLHLNDAHNISYTNDYIDTAAPSASSLDTRGDRVETVNTLLSSNTNRIALDFEFGLNSDSLLTRAVLGVSLFNLRLNNSYTETTTVYNDAAGVDNAVRDSENILSSTGQYSWTGAVTPGFDMNTNNPQYLSTIDVGIGSSTELALGDLNLVIPFDLGYAFPLGSLQTVYTDTTVSYNDAAADNPETARTTTTTTTTLDPGLDLYTRLGAGVKKVFTPAENATVTVVPVFSVALDIMNNTRSRTESVRTQSDNDGNGDYTSAGDADTTYTESGWEIQAKNLTTTFDLNVPLSVQWEANELLTFHAGYNMNLRFALVSSNSLTTGDNAYVYEQYTDNITAANSYLVRQKNGANNTSTPNSSLSMDFSDPLTGNGQFGVALKISDSLTLDLKATGSQVAFTNFTVMGIMNY